MQRPGPRAPAAKGTGQAMRFLVPIGGVTEGVFGVITAPNHKGVPAGIRAGLPWAADVGCIEGPDFVKRANLAAVMDWLKNCMMPYKESCLFIAGFDIVGDSVGSLESFEEFSRYFISGGWPWAYVAQNGAEDLPIPSEAAAVFIGGVPMEDRDYSTARHYGGQYRQMEWKESPEAVTVIKRAQQMGKHIHIGRVNWKRRYELFNVLEGSEHFTCDGTRTRYDGSKKAINAWRAYEAQRPLITI